MFNAIMPKTIVETRCSGFSLFDTFTCKEETKVTISVREYKYENDQHYYYIDYTFNPKNIDILSKDHEDGEIVFKNEMTSTMIDYLLKSDEELYKNTGNTTVSDYRKFIMRSLSNFWD
jgi:hypothetical protein